MVYVDDATIACRCTRRRRWEEVVFFVTRSGKVVLGRMEESDEDGHESRGGDGTTAALYWLRGWRLRMGSWEKEE